ncbi:MAG: EFR1 family ferrodoxin [Treponema sp.]|nr:EFR1 family ferrodoxin [Treponema sp.]
MANIIFYFSGTGNCLMAAKQTAEQLGAAEIVCMATANNYRFTKQYDTIGFIYPVYFAGLPQNVYSFINNLDFGNNKTAYCYAIASYGGMPGNGLSQFNELLLNKHGIKLNYGTTLRMFSNYVIMFNMNRNAAEIIQRSEEALHLTINEVKSRAARAVSKSIPLLAWYYRQKMKAVPGMDKDYNINQNCTGCGICKEVCPVQNIELAEGRPRFKHHCEQCVACIQYCPQKAINYKNLTQKRRRYTNPAITCRDLAEMNRGGR